MKDDKLVLVKMHNHKIDPVNKHITSSIINVLFSFSVYHGDIKKFNSGEYQVILRKELTKSDVANVGRIVLPKV
jgi:hypothetical protein